MPSLRDRVQQQQKQKTQLVFLRWQNATDKFNSINSHSGIYIGEDLSNEGKADTLEFEWSKSSEPRRIIILYLCVCMCVRVCICVCVCVRVCVWVHNRRY